MIVAIDGPAGSGKSTLARRLADELGLPYVNTGSMYRALALAAVREGLDPDDRVALAARAGRIRFDLDTTVEPPELSIDGERATRELSAPEVEAVVSRVARHPEVRAVMRDRQRALISGGAVVEGRDIGSVVAPDADVKLYLQAEVEARIDRRAAERAASEAVGEALRTRDTLDSGTNPFVPAADARVIDTTALDRDAVFAHALEVVRRRSGEP